MSFPGAIHTCTIRNRTTSTTDGGSEQFTYSDLATLVPCRLYAPKPDELASGQVAVTHRMMLPYGQAVNEADRIASVVSADGTTLGSEFEIVGVNHDPSGQFHHVEVDLKEVRENL